MENNLTYHVTMFNDRVRGMNQTHKTELRMTDVEANNLLSDIFAILAQVSALKAAVDDAQITAVEVVMDGGGFK
jgi:hypothetical protein